MSKHTVLLLGLGMQGRAALHDLLRADEVSQVIVADNRPVPEAHLGGTGIGVSVVKADANDAKVISGLMRKADVVIELLPGRFAYPMARLAVENGVSHISTMYLADPGESDPARVRAREVELAELDAEAKAKGITVLPEFGMDPGIDLALGMQAVRELDEVHEFYSYGAGFPELECADNPLKYKFTWSVEGLLRSYFRPARVLMDGKVIGIPPEEMFAPSNMHVLDLDEVGGPLECFPNGDAVKYAEAFGIYGSVKTMGRYICRWPGHGCLWHAIAACGFLGETPVRVRDIEVVPLEFMAGMLESQGQFHYGPKERDVALIRVDARGLKNGKRARVIYQIVDKRDLNTGFTAMNRTVGFSATIAARMVLLGEICQRGLISPMDVPLHALLRELGKRGVEVNHSVTPWH